MDSNDRPWVRVELREAEGHYDGEVVARVSDAIVVNALGDERTFAGTHVFPLAAIASESPAPHSSMQPMSKALWGTRDRAVVGDSIRAILQARPSDRLVVVEELGDSEVCWIGFPRVEDDVVVLDEVDPNGDRTGAARYAIDGLARVAWGGGYLLALEERLRTGTVAVEQFVATVRAFIEIIERGAESRALQRVLAELHMRALDLPDWVDDADVDDEGGGPPPPCPVPDLLYWDVFAPCTPTPEEPVANSLADDLSGIWHDVTGGLRKHDAGDRDAACSHWKLMHQVHWGEHCVGALRALHLADLSSFDPRFNPYDAPSKVIEKELPVPQIWRRTIERVVNRFVVGDYVLAEEVEGVAPVQPVTATQIGDYVEDYGATLAALNPESWETSLAIWTGDGWEVLVDLSTKEEGQSDLVLHLFVKELGSQFLFDIHMVYVP